MKRSLTEREYSKQFENLIRQGELASVQDKLSETTPERHPLSRVIHAGVTVAMNLGGRGEIQGKMDEVLLDEVSQIERREPVF